MAPVVRQSHSKYSESSLSSGLTFPPAVVPAAYIKVYLLENGICVAKKKTKSVRKSLDPLYNQVLVFSESPQGKVVQVRYNTTTSQHRLKAVVNKSKQTQNSS